MGLCTSSATTSQPLADTKGIQIPKSSERLLSLNNALSCAEIFAQLKDANESSLYKALDLMATAPGLNYETLFEGLSPLHALASSTKTGFEWDTRGSGPVRIDISDDLLHEIYLRIMWGSPRTLLGIMTQKTDEENMSALHVRYPTFFCCRSPFTFFWLLLITVFCLLSDRHPPRQRRDLSKTSHRTRYRYSRRNASLTSDHSHVRSESRQFGDRLPFTSARGGY